MTAKRSSLSELLCFEVSIVSTRSKAISLSPLLSAAWLSAFSLLAGFDSVPPFWVLHSAGCAIVYFLWVFNHNITSLRLATTCSRPVWAFVSPKRKWSKKSGRLNFVCICACLLACLCWGAQKSVAPLWNSLTLFWNLKTALGQREQAARKKATKTKKKRVTTSKWRRKTDW